MTEPLQPTSYTRRDFVSMQAELSRIVKATRPDLWTDFYSSNLGTTLLNLLAVVGDILSYGMDANAVETFVATCRRYESALRFAQGVGYRVHGPAAAEVSVSVATLPASVTLNGGYIEVGASLTGANGKTYILLQAAVINAGETDSTLVLVEGAWVEETFAAAGAVGQEATTAATGVADRSWQVFVGDPTDPDNLWEEVDNLVLTRRAGKNYEARYTPTGAVVIRFGDGVDAGAVPDAGITVRMRTCAGAAGNAPVGAISGTLTIHLLAVPGTVSAEYVSDTAASGGEDRETVADLRVNIPAFLRSSGRVVTQDDYETAVTQVAGVALSICRTILSGPSQNVVYVYPWGTQQLRVGATPFVAQSASSGYVSRVDYTRWAQLSYTLVNDIQQYLRARTVVTIHHVVVRQTVAAVDLYFGPVRYDPRLDPVEIHRRIVEAVVGVFATSGGFVVRISDVFQAVDAVPGVRSFTIQRVVYQHLSRGFATGSIIFVGGANPTDAEWIRIDDGQQVNVFEFDNNGSVVGSNVLVPIGATAADTLTNLLNLINAHTMVLAARDATALVPSLLLRQQLSGSVYNLAITKSAAAITVTGMSGGSDTLAEVTQDYRADQNPVVDSWPPGPDPHPPLHPEHPDYATDNGPGDGVQPYEPLQDVVVQDAISRRHYYDDSYLYNDEIYYDSVEQEGDAIQCLNLRGLIFEMQKG